MLPYLAKRSRRHRVGPSYIDFQRTSRLRRRHSTFRTAYTSFDFPSVRGARKAFQKLQNCVKKKNTVVETTRCIHPKTRARYVRIVVQHGKHRFHDDLELLLNQKKIDIRSSSRVGVCDMGVNGERVDAIVGCARFCTLNDNKKQKQTMKGNVRVNSTGTSIAQSHTCANFLHRPVVPGNAGVGTR